MKYSIKNIKEIIIFSSSISWSLLGYKRGINDYEYRFKNWSNIIKNDTKIFKNTKYLEKISIGMIGIMVYACPLFIFYTLPKEIYRLNVNIKNLENEKNTHYYKSLIL